MLGLDIEKTALEIVKADFKRKKIPLSKAGKYLSASNPYSNNSSASKSYNVSASKSASKHTALASSVSGTKEGDTSVAAPSAFLTYEQAVAPYKRTRVDSETFGQVKLFSQPKVEENLSA